jgi:bisphosphoglycerate-dependent phosphoglycerate mutase
VKATAIHIIISATGSLLRSFQKHLEDVPEKKKRNVELKKGGQSEEQRTSRGKV